MRSQRFLVYSRLIWAGDCLNPSFVRHSQTDTQLKAIVY